MGSLFTHLNLPQNVLGIRPEVNYQPPFPSFRRASNINAILKVLSLRLNGCLGGNNYSVVLTAHLLRYIKENETSFPILKDFFVILRLRPNTDFNNLTLKNVGKMA